MLQNPTLCTVLSEHPHTVRFNGTNQQFKRICKTTKPKYLNSNGMTALRISQLRKVAAAGVNEQMDIVYASPDSFSLQRRIVETSGIYPADWERDICVETVE